MAMNVMNALPIHKMNEVVMCDALHYSMITPIEYKSNQHHSMIVKWWKPKFRYSFDYEDLYGLITENTSMVIIPHVSNITGVVFDIKTIIQKLRSLNNTLIIMVDGVSYLPHDMIDVYDWDVDFYFVSFYKFLGPHISAVYVKNIHMLQNLNHYFVQGSKLELGSFPNECLVGLLGIQDYMLRDYFGNIDVHIKIDRRIIHSFFNRVNAFESYFTQLCDKYLERSKIFEAITDSTGNEKRFPIISLQSKYCSMSHINLYLNEIGIMSSYGKFHCLKLLDEDVLRISFLHYNDIDEIHHIFEELRMFEESYFHKTIFQPLKMFRNIFIEEEQEKDFTLHKLELSKEFIHKYNELTIDSNYENTRYRRYSLIDTTTFLVYGTKFIQSKQYNPTKNGGIIRKYKPINVCDDPCFHKIVTYFVAYVKNISGLDCTKCMVHQIRVEVNNDSVTPVPEGIHQDGYNYVGIMCVSRNNIQGGVNKIYTLDEEEIYNKVLDEGEMIIMNDRKVKHYVSNITRKDSLMKGYRDILVMTSVF
jgi:selenocysteine lyase/cysteine desulfurase